MITYLTKSRNIPIPSPLLLSHQNSLSHRRIHRLGVKVSLPSQKTLLLRTDEPVAQDPPVGVQDHCHLPLIGLHPGLWVRNRAIASAVPQINLCRS